MSETATGFVLGIILTLVLEAIILMGYFKATPSAIDVYQGKTTLEITYREISADDILNMKIENKF